MPDWADGKDYPNTQSPTQPGWAENISRHIIGWLDNYTNELKWNENSLYKDYLKSL